MKKVIFFLLVILGIALSCKREAPHAEDAVIQQAQEYYRLLIKGEYDAFLSGIDGADGLPADYREQLMANTCQFVDVQKKQRGGMIRVEGLRAVIDSAATTHANAFLLICFGDSTREEVVVPMVERQGKWLMR
ncbi:MAG: hypothetical protein ACI4BA_00280 [Prevotella sp.]